MVCIIVSGAVAVGKSFIINLLTEWFGEENIYLFPEFIHDDDVGQGLLKKSFKKEISPLTLQSYVMDKWLYNLKEGFTHSSENKIKLFERLPIDAFEIFSSNLTESGKRCLLDIMKQMEEYFHYDYTFPPNETLWIQYNNSLVHDNSKRLKETIFHYIQSKKYIVIEIMSENPFQNYLRRSRRGEIYSEDSINDIYKRYENFLEVKRAQFISSIITIN